MSVFQVHAVALLQPLVHTSSKLHENSAFKDEGIEGCLRCASSNAGS